MEKEANKNTALWSKIQEKPKLIVILGPTASGKTELALELAKKIMAKSLMPIQDKFIKKWISEQGKWILDIGYWISI